MLRVFSTSRHRPSLQSFVFRPGRKFATKTCLTYNVRLMRTRQEHQPNTVGTAICFVFRSFVEIESLDLSSTFSNTLLSVSFDVGSFLFFLSSEEKKYIK